MTFRSQRTALAGRPGAAHSPRIGRDAGAACRVPSRARPQRRSLSALREILVFLATGGDEGRAANRYRR